MAKGRYHKWLEPENLTLLEGWARSGLSNDQIANNMGITRSTFYEWQNKHTDISDAIKKGKEVTDFEVENAMYKAAMGYEFEEVKTYIEETDAGRKKRIERTVKHVAPNVTAQIFWLKNRKPDTWRDRTEQQINANVSTDKLTDILTQLGE